MTPLWLLPLLLNSNPAHLRACIGDAPVLTGKMIVLFGEDRMPRFGALPKPPKCRNPTGVAEHCRCIEDAYSIPAGLILLTKLPENKIHRTHHKTDGVGPHKEERVAPGIKERHQLRLGAVADRRAYPDECKAWQESSVYTTTRIEIVTEQEANQRSELHSMREADPPHVKCEGASSMVCEALHVPETVHPVLDSLHGEARKKERYDGHPKESIAEAKAC